MKSLADVAVTVLEHAGVDAAQNVCTAAAAEPPATWLRRIWERMTALYGHAWVNLHGVTPHDKTGALSLSGDTWARALDGLLGQQISAGIKACVAEGAEFPPSAPRFRAMSLGVPSLASVRSELRHGGSSPFARAIWAELDVYRYRQASADQGDRLLRDAYELVRERVMRGHALPEPPAAVITHDSAKPAPATPEQREKHIATIRALLATGDGGEA